MLHLLLLLISLEPAKTEIIIDQRKLIPIDLASKQQAQPPAVSNQTTAPPEVDEIIPELPAPREAEPEPLPTPESVPVPVPESIPEMAAEPISPPRVNSPETSASAGPAQPAAEDNNSVSSSAGAPQTANPFEGLIGRINLYKKSTYPLSARKKGYQGTVYIQLVIDEEGNMLSAEILQKSSHSSLNSAALKLIDKIMEKPYPHNLGKTVKIRLPITYKLD